MNIKLLLLSIIILLTSSCLFPNQPTQRKSLTLGDTLSIQYRETLYNDIEDISVSFKSVVEDSRCPRPFVCFWAGNAKLLFTFSSGGDKRFCQLNTYYNFTKDTTLFGYKFSLISVSPYPHADSSYTHEDYKAFIVINK